MTWAPVFVDRNPVPSYTFINALVIEKRPSAGRATSLPPPAKIWSAIARTAWATLCRPETSGRPVMIFRAAKLNSGARCGIVDGISSSPVRAYRPRKSQSIHETNVGPEEATGPAL